jgi:4-amino-4-deoxy-L-arabinose transferase-like glycosyltransferase
LFWISGLLLLGISVGSFALQDIPIAIIPDEDQFWQTARAIAVGQMDPVIFDSGVFTFPIASSIYQGWVLRLFGATLWAWRFSSVIAGVLVIIPLYLLAKDWFGHTVAVVTSVLMIANPYFISFSRLGYNNSQSLLPVTLCIYFFALAARNGGYFYLWLSGLVAGFGFYTYSATWLGPVVIGLGTLSLWLWKAFNWKHTLIILGIVLFGWGIAFVPRVAYVASGNERESLVYRIFVASFANAFYGRTYYGEADLANTMPLIQIGEQHTLFYDPVIYGELIFRGVVRSFLALFNPHIISNHFLVSGLIGVVTPVFFLIGLGVSLRSSRQLRFALPVMWFLGGVILLSVISAYPPAQTHLVSIIPVIALLSAIGLVAVIESITELLFKRHALLQMPFRNILIAVASLTILYLGLQRYFTIMPATYRPTFENIPLWIARRTETPVSIVYLGQPRKASRIGQLLNTSGVSHQYTPVVINEFSPETRLTKAPIILFIESGQARQFALLQKPPAGYHQPVAYHDEDGNVIGYAITNTDIDLKPQIGMEAGIRSLTRKPVGSVLAVLLVIVFVFGFLAWRDAPRAPAAESSLIS